MKTITWIILPLIVLGVQARPARSCARGATDATCRTAPASAVTLSADESKALIFQAEEERLAREIYTALGEKWGLRQFAHVRRAEARHEEMLRALAARAGVALPEATPGKFTDPVLQARHDALLARGLVSAAEALAAGAAVERQDIADLQALSGTAKSEALKTVVANLTRASERHLAAFTGEGGRGRAARTERGSGRRATCDQTGRRARS